MKRLVICAFLVLLCTSLALGQTSTATLQGTIKDATGASVAGATLTARNTDTDQSRTAISGPASLCEKFSFLYPGLRAGGREMAEQHIPIPWRPGRSQK